MAVASLVLGILSLLVGLFGGIISWSGALLGIIGIVLAVQGRKNPEQKGMATAGLVLSIIGTIVSLVFFIACAACVGALSAL